MWCKQSTALTLIVGPILDATGAEYTGAIIGDLSISKNGGTLTALAAAATLTHVANGQYTLVLTTGNTDTLGALQILCNKSTYQMPTVERQVLPATVYDALTTNAVNTTGGLPAATGAISALAGAVSTYAGADTAGTTTLLSRVTGAVPLAADYTTARAAKLDNLDAAVSTRSTFAGGAVASVTAPVTVGANADKTGYALTSAYDPAKTAAQTGEAATAAASLQTHGDLAWATAVGFAVAGDAMALTPTERTAVAAAWGASVVGNGRTRDMYLQGYVNKVVQSADGLSLTIYASDDATVLQTVTETRLATTVGGIRNLTPR